MVGESPVVGSSEWIQAQSKRNKNKAKKQAAKSSTLKEKGKPSQDQDASRPAKDVKEKVTRKPPRTAAVAIKVTDQSLTYSEVMRKVRENVQLSEFGIERTKIRYAANGDALIEIPGAQNAEKAEKLKDKLADLLKDYAKVSRPVIRGDIRLSGFDDSVAPSEIAETIAEIGGCSPKDIKMGEIRKLKNSLCTVWIQCPLASAVKASKSGKVRIGWTVARIVLLKARPIRCYKCWETGHLRNNCKSSVDRSFACYNCGSSGHSARVCDSSPSCPICKELGLQFDHRMGTATCRADEYLSERGKAKSKNQAAGIPTQSARRAEHMETDYE
ncbi:hypothetical protein ACFW04_012696 [Cataglyphis niger]